MARALDDFDPAYGMPVACAPSVRRVTCDNSGPMTGPGTNTYLVGDGPLVVVDPGPDDGAHVAAVAAAVAGAPVEAVVVTHLHRDHTGGAKALAARLRAPLIACDPALRRRPLVEGLGVDMDFVPDAVVGDGARLTAGDTMLDVVFTPGHGSDHICLGVTARDGRCLLSGDHVMGWSTSVVAPPYGHMGDFMASLRRLLERPEVPFLPGHGDVVPAPHAHMRALLNHRQAREGIILDRIQDGFADLPAIARASYPELDARLLAAAELSTLAHVEHLEEQGLVRRDADGHISRAKAHPANVGSPDAL